MATTFALLGLLLASCSPPPPETPRPGSGQPLPSFILRDPAGKEHPREALISGGLILVVTAPTLANKEAQIGWSEHLTREMPDHATVVFLENMDESAFKWLARDSLEDSYTPGQSILLLLDEDGAVSRSLGVHDGDTVLFVFNAEGALEYSYSGEPSAEAADAAWARYKAAKTAPPPPQRDGGAPPPNAR